MAEPHIGSAAVTLTIDKEQVAAEAKAALVPAVDAAAKEASSKLSAATSSGGGGIKAMIDQQKQLAAETRATTLAQREEAAAFAASIDQTSNQAGTGTGKIRGLGAAAADVGSAFGGAAGEATQLASVLAYGGLAGGAAIGVAKLAELGDSMNATALSAQQLLDLAGKTGEQAAATFNIANQFGDPAAQLKQLTEEGAAGIGTILNMRDAALAAGQDTSKFDTALEQFNATFDNTAGTVQRGTKYIEELGTAEQIAAVHAKELAEAAQRLEGQFRTEASAASSLLTSQVSIVAAQDRVREAKKRLSDFGTDANAKSVSQQLSEARAVEDASHRIVEARQKILDAERKVADAREKLADAGKHEALAVADAQDAVDAAQRKVNASTPEERGPAQHALNDAKQKLEDAKKALDKAQPDAERALDAAVRGLAEAQYDEQRAVESLGDAQEKQTEQSKAAKKSQKDYQSAVDDVNAALFAQAQATAQQKIIQEELASGIKVGPVEALKILRDSLDEVSGSLDPSGELAQRIIYLLASMTPQTAQQVLQIATTGHPFKQSARGNHLAAGEPSWVGDKYGMQNAELFVPDVPGTVVPTTPAELAAMGGSSRPTVVHHHTYNIVVQSVKEPAERTIRRELDRIKSLAGV
jgi:hypothetical protein